MPDCRFIIIDNREQRGWDFPLSKRACLRAGDYSLEGLEDQIAIERKSIDDYVGTILRSHVRFSKELEKLKTYRFAAVVVECSFSDIVAGRYTSDVSPSSVIGMTVAMMVKYWPVQFLFAGDRVEAQAFVGRLLARLDEKWGEKDNAKKESS